MMAVFFGISEAQADVLCATKAGALSVRGSCKATEKVVSPSSIGAQGAAGPAGAQGIQGPQGSKGDTGAQGSQGPQGATGAQGIQGPIGVQGLSGVQGESGPRGVTGPEGPRGATGVQGPVGPSSRYKLVDLNSKLLGDWTPGMGANGQGVVTIVVGGNFVSAIFDSQGFYMRPNVYYDSPDCSGVGYVVVGPQSGATIYATNIQTNIYSTQNRGLMVWSGEGAFARTLPVGSHITDFTYACTRGFAVSDSTFTFAPTTSFNLAVDITAYAPPFRVVAY